MGRAAGNWSAATIRARRCTHEFSEHSGQTTVTTTVRYATPEGRDAVLRYSMASGKGESGDRLVELLTDILANHRKELP